MWRQVCWWGLLCACCSSDPLELRVEVLTDYVPGIEFTSVQTTVSGSQIVHQASSTDEFELGVTVARVDVERGEYPLRVSLIRDDVVILTRELVATVGTEDVRVRVVLSECDDCFGDGSVGNRDGGVGCGDVCTIEGTCQVGVLSCRGPTPECQGVGAAPAGTPCRPALGVCDEPEFCNGLSEDCPADERKEPGEVCRASAYPCDAAETCNGGLHCPEDSPAPDGVECRAPACGTDMGETCSGGACPPACGCTGQPCCGTHCEDGAACTGGRCCPLADITAGGDFRAENGEGPIVLAEGLGNRIRFCVDSDRCGTIALSDDVSVTGSAQKSQGFGRIETSGNELRVCTINGNGCDVLRFTGATLSGRITFPADARLRRVTADGSNTLLFRGWGPESATITLHPAAICR